MSTAKCSTVDLKGTHPSVVYLDANGVELRIEVDHAGQVYFEIKPAVREGLPDDDIPMIDNGGIGNLAIGRIMDVLAVARERQLRGGAKTRLAEKKEDLQKNTA